MTAPPCTKLVSSHLLTYSLSHRVGHEMHVGEFGDWANLTIVFMCMYSIQVYMRSHSIKDWSIHVIVMVSGPTV